MLKVHVPMGDSFDEVKQEFVPTELVELELEHSLVSLSKWEAHWEKPFLGKEEKTTEQTLWYIRAMTLTPNVPDAVYESLAQNKEVVEQINKYIEAKMTATWIREMPGGRNNGETITAELIYYWMVSLNIWKECENWHLNRLITFVRVCNEKNKPPKKMRRHEIAGRNRQLNEERRARLGTRG